MSKLIYGKNSIENIVSIEVLDNQILLFIEKNGEIITDSYPNKYWILSNKQFTGFERLEGNLYYKYIRTYDYRDEFIHHRQVGRKYNMYSVYNEKEAAMLYTGITQYKNMKVEDVSVLAFDIEATNIPHTADSKVLLISNTFRKNGKITRKLFQYDQYNSDTEMIADWCRWVREMNPSVMIGHNIYGYDLPYLNYCGRDGLALGRDGSDLEFMNYPSKFRRDSSQYYNYQKVKIFGREVVDTMYLSMKHDVDRKYDSYALKQIIKQEGLEVKNRQHYDASKIKDNYKDQVEWEKIKKYAMFDADDALALYDLMIPPFFYLAQSVPKSFQEIMVGASGSQVNSIMVRGYIQDKHSLPKPTDVDKFEGAISLGNKGVYHNVAKIDVKSLYPSIMLQYKVCNKLKDPKNYFLSMVKHFTEERLKNKDLGDKTGDRYYVDMSQMGKIVINSMYGFMGASGLMFNSPDDAAFVTKKGREILTNAVEWATGHTLKKIKNEDDIDEWVLGDKVNEGNGYTLVNADTDSIAINKEDKKILDEERKYILTEINKLSPELIVWDDDGYFKNVLVIKAKNYVLDDGRKRKIKGSALKATTKEIALQEFIKEMIDNLLGRKKDRVIHIYMKYVKEIFNLTDISRWTSKKTITEKVLKPERTNEQKVLDAIDPEQYSMGDKIRVYFTEDEKLKLEENWNNDHDKDKLLHKLYKTLDIFSTVIDVDCFPNYELKRNKDILKEVTHEEKDSTCA